MLIVYIQYKHLIYYSTYNDVMMLYNTVTSTVNMLPHFKWNDLILEP